MTISRTKHIVFISRWYPSDNDKMLGLFVRNHALAAVSAGYKVTVVYATPSNQKSYGRNETKINLDSENFAEVITYYKSGTRTGIFQQLLAFYKSFKLAVKTRGRPDLIHAHILTRVALIAAFYAKLYKVPYVITEHWSRYYDENFGYSGALRKYLTQKVISKATSVSTVSNRLYKSMINRGLTFKQVILPNVVDTEVFNIGKKENSVFTFVSISCFEEKSKNLKLLIDAGAKLRERDIDFEIMFIGDGSDRKLIEDYAETHSFKAKFLGLKSQVDAGLLIKKAHCLVVSSNYETFGIVAYEAMATGLPVISTDVADLKEFIDKDNGIVVPVKDVEALSQAMHMVIKNFENYNPYKIRERVEEFCSVKAIAGKLDEIYVKAIQK